MDLLLIKLERVDNDFYESLIKFISDHGYKPKVIAHNGAPEGMPFDCVGATMHIEGLILEIGCHVCQYKYGRYYLEEGRVRRQADQLKKFL